MKLFGKTFVRTDAAKPPADAVGSALDRMIAAALPQSAAAHRRTQAARAAAAKRQKEEDRAIAKSFGISLEESE